MLYRCRSLSFVFVLASLALIFSISGCDGEPPVVPPEDLVKEGWKHLEAGPGEYEEAKEDFEAAIDSKPDIDILVEAYVGLGWTDGKMLNLQESIANFQSALSMKPQDADALAGVAVAYLANDQYDQAITSADQVLAIKPNYSFEHDGVTAEDMRVVLAESYYYKGDFYKAEEQLNILDPTRKPLDPSKPEYPAELLKELEKASGG